MWHYVKHLEFPLSITKSDLKMAKLIYTQLGGADGELRAAIRYLCQSFSMPTEESRCLLREIATEELAHVEMICEMIKQLTKNVSLEEIEAANLDTNYVDHKLGIFPTDANGVPMSVIGIGVKGNYIADLVEDMAAEAKAKATYEALMDLTDNPEVLSPLSFLREREVVHFQRFGEMLMKLQEKKP